VEISRASEVTTLWRYTNVFIKLPPNGLRKLEQNLSTVHASDNVEATFDFVAKNGNNVERVLR